MTIPTQRSAQLDTTSAMDDEPLSSFEGPLKRRRISPAHSPLSSRAQMASPLSDRKSSRLPFDSRTEYAENMDKPPRSAASKIVSVHGEAMTAYLKEHVPNTYQPLGSSVKSPSHEHTGLNSKYCYRHRPDLKCRRPANQPSMDQLQHEVESLSGKDKEAINTVWNIFSGAPARQRRLILDGILNACCFPQLSLLHGRIKNLIAIDFPSVLPTELSLKILCYLDTISLCKAAQVSHRWRTLADDDIIWHRMCEQHIDRKCTKCGWGLPLLERKRLRSCRRQLHLRSAGQQSSPQQKSTHRPSTLDDEATSMVMTNGDPSPSSIASKKPHETGEAVSDEVKGAQLTRPWKDVYRDRYKVGLNWKHGRCSIKTFKGHTNGVMCLQFDDDVLMTGSYDTTVKIWDISSGQVIRTLQGHTSGIRCLQFTETTLFTGSLDKTIKVWNWRTGECINTLSGHRDGVISLHLDGNVLASGSIDSTIKVWDFQGNKSFTLRGHDNWVNAVKVDGASRTVFSASDDLTVKLWDLDTHLVIKCISGHAGFIQQIVLFPHEFELEKNHDEGNHDGSSSNRSSRSSSPLVPRADSGPVVQDSYGDGYGSSDRPRPHRYILTSALDNTIRMWDTATGECVHKYFGHVEGVWALAGDMLRMVSGSEDKCVKVWDPQTERCERTFTGHAGPVTCIGLGDSRFCTGSEDCEVRMYSF